VQAADLSIKVIRDKCSHIRNNLDTYVTTKTVFSDESTEGAQGIAFYDCNELKLIEVIWFGEIGKKITEYYFDNGKLIFAFNKAFNYNRPIYWDEKIAKENEDNEVFNPKKTSVKEDRFYFRDERLFHWTNNEKKEVDLSLETNSIVGQSLIAHAYKMRTRLIK
jgi:hypothetical protein